MKSQVLYLMLFLANMVYGFTSVNNLNTLNKFVPNNRNKLVSIKMVDKDLDIQKKFKTPRRYMLLYGATVSLFIIDLVQSVRYPQYNLKILENVQNNLFKEATPSICNISTEYGNMADKYNLDKDDLPKGVGSGFVWDENGHIVTNFHVINKVDNAIVTITDKNMQKKNIKQN